MIKKPRKASTIIIVKECDKKQNEFKVLMLQRHPGNKFMPLKYVFPGGSMDLQDKKPELVNYCYGLSKDSAMKIISDNDLKEKSIASWITGIRETFEETGLCFYWNMYEQGWIGKG